MRIFLMTLPYIQLYRRFFYYKIYLIKILQFIAARNRYTCYFQSNYDNYLLTNVYNFHLSISRLPQRDNNFKIFILFVCKLKRIAETTDHRKCPNIKCEKALVHSATQFLNYQAIFILIILFNICVMKKSSLE